MSINLSQLKADKIRVTIPLFINDEFVDNIEIYNPTNDIVGEINQAIQNQTYNDFNFKNKLIKELTNINVDCELDDSYIKYYSDIFVQVMLEIDNIILEVLTNYMMQIDKLQSIPENKLEVVNNIMENFEEQYKSNEEELKQIEIEKETSRQKRELQRQIEEASIKLKQLEGEAIG